VALVTRMRSGALGWWSGGGQYDEVRPPPAVEGVAHAELVSVSTAEVASVENQLAGLEPSARAKLIKRLLSGGGSPLPRARWMLAEAFRKGADENQSG